MFRRTNDAGRTTPAFNDRKALDNTKAKVNDAKTKDFSILKTRFMTSPRWLIRERRFFRFELKQLPEPGLDEV